jgi:hypothetical protein
MVDNKTPSIVIVRHEDEPRSLSDKMLQQYVEASEPEISSSRRMFALIILVFIVGTVGAIGGGIIRLLAKVNNAKVK